MGFIERLIGEEPSLFSQWLHSDDLGHFGEYMIEYALNNNVFNDSKILTNVYVPYKNKTTEIDVVLF